MLPSMLHSAPLIATITIGGFNGIAAAFGVIGLIQVSQFVYYGLDQNDPSKDWSSPRLIFQLGSLMNFFRLTDQSLDKFN